MNHHRSKDLISQLQQKVTQLSKEKAELEREKDVMRAQMQLLEEQNKTLLLSQPKPGSSTNGLLVGLAQQQRIPAASLARAAAPSALSLSSADILGGLSLQGVNPMAIRGNNPLLAAALLQARGLGQDRGFYH